MEVNTVNCFSTKVSRILVQLYLQKSLWYTVQASDSKICLVTISVVLVKKKINENI